MSKKYEDYDYEVEDNDRQILIKRALIIILVIIAVVIIVYLLRSCTKTEKPGEEKPIVQTNEYENMLLEAANKYFDLSDVEIPESAGECVKVTLGALREKKLIDTTKFDTCEENNTFVNVCKLENGNIQYTPWFTCQDKKSENEYDALKEGNINDVKANQTYVEFKFMPQVLKTTNLILGSTNEAWESELKGKSYKTLSTTTYYRYRDKEYKWNLITKYYYGKDNEYYTSKPNNEYTEHDEGVTTYKWFKRDYKMENGSKDYSATEISGYPVQGEVIKYAKGYFMPTSSSKTYKPIAYHVCTAYENGSGTQILTPYPCDARPGISKSEMDEFKYEQPMIYSCTGNQLNEKDPKIKANQVKSANSTCYYEWAQTNTTCNAENDNCKVIDVPMYSWYKKVYYSDNIYYENKPADGYEKDEKTKTTAYRWFKKSTSTTKEYTKEAPKGEYSYAEKTSEYKWTDWSDWSTNKTTKSDSRSVETKKKIKYQMYESNGDETWENLSDTYVNLSDMLAIFNSKGFVANNLADINANGEIRYQLKMYIRNKKEDK